MIGVVILLAVFIAGLLIGAQIARYRLTALLGRLNAERDLRDQAVGADLLRQLERTRGRL